MIIDYIECIYYCKNQTCLLTIISDISLSFYWDWKLHGVTRKGFNLNPILSLLNGTCLSCLPSWENTKQHQRSEHRGLISIRQWHETNDLDLSNWWSVCHIWSGMHVSLVLKTKTARVVGSCQIFLEVNYRRYRGGTTCADMGRKGFDSLDERRYMKWHNMPLRNFFSCGFCK